VSKCQGITIFVFLSFSQIERYCMIFIFFKLDNLGKEHKGNSRSIFARHIIVLKLIKFLKDPWGILMCSQLSIGLNFKNIQILF
jgi:hypothetical protein